MVEKSECPNCSASVQPGSERCSFCGQWFKISSKDGKIDRETWENNLKTSLKFWKEEFKKRESPSQFLLDAGSRVVGYFAPRSILGPPGITRMTLN